MGQAAIGKTPFSARHLRGQVTIEFLLVFLAAIAFFTLLVAAIGAANGRAKAQAGAIATTAGMEEFARTFEVYANDGIAMFFSAGAPYRIENGVVKTEYENKTVVIGGIFDAPASKDEPA